MLARLIWRAPVGAAAGAAALNEPRLGNQISAEIFPIPTYKEGAARCAPYDAVADYLDTMSARARQLAA